jgi:hypothetical protein
MNGMIQGLLIKEGFCQRLAEWINICHRVISENITHRPLVQMTWVAIESASKLAAYDEFRVLLLMMMIKKTSFESY